MIIWFTGLPCSGKTTLGRLLSKELGAELLDGDELRNSVFSRGAGFSLEERTNHLLRVGYLANKLSKYTNVVCTFIVPTNGVRMRLAADLWIYTKCSREKCIERDVKGMWARALKGEIKSFTGLDGIYEEPNNALIVNTEKYNEKECIDYILKNLAAGLPILPKLPNSPAQ